MADETYTPLVTIIVTTYNREGTVGKAIQSVLRQTYTNLDVLVVDDGSVDGTRELLSGITDPRLRVVRHEKNRGVNAAKNTGLNGIRGEWFTFVDSDDEIMSEAIEAMIEVPRNHLDVTQVECNGIDADSGALTGYGYAAEGYIDPGTYLETEKGDYWGLIKTSLLGPDRLNENLPGFELILWRKVMRRSKAYYIHRPLVRVHTGGGDRLTVARWSAAKAASIFEHLLEEGEYLEVERETHPGNYRGTCMQGYLYTLAAGDRVSAQAWKARILGMGSGKLSLVAGAAGLFGPSGARWTLAAMGLARKLLRKAG